MKPSKADVDVAGISEQPTGIEASGSTLWTST